MAGDSALGAVLAFCAAWSSGSAECVAGYFAENAVWENGPIETLEGRAVIRAKLDGVMAAVERIEFIVLSAAETPDGTVLTERLDRIHFRDRVVDLRLMGLFRLESGQITLWRDYFDLATYKKAMGAPGW